ncbi:MAG: hypothetical protein ACOYK1_01125 [Vampirovibrionia bacterium]
MTDHLGSVNFNNSSLDFPSNTSKSTGVLLADALMQGIQQSSENKAIEKEANLHDLHDPSLAPRLAMESQAGNKVPSPQDLNQMLGPSTQQAVINELHLKGLTTAASGETNAPEKMGAFMAAASMPWASSEAVLKPQYDSAVIARNPFVEAVRENPIAKIAALTFIPTTPFALWTLMGGQTKSDEALSLLSLAQNEFVVKGITDGSILEFSTKVKNGIRFLNGIEIPSINAESDPSLKFAALLLEKAGRTVHIPEDGVTKPYICNKVEERHIAAATKLLDELNEFLTKDSKDIASDVGENGGPFALKAMVQAVSGVPPLLEAKYHAGPKVDSLIKTIGIDEKQAEGHLKTLDGVGSFFKKILGLQVKKAETVLEEARKSSEIISKQAAQQIMTGLAKTVNDPDTRQGIHDVNRDLANLATQFVQTVSNRANEGLTSNLASVNEAIARASKAGSN